MKLQDLIEELHIQADEAMTTATISVPELRGRRSRVRRRRMGSSAVAVALVLAVVWVAGSVGATRRGALEPSDRPPAPTSPTQTPSSMGWTAVRCSSAATSGCAVPVSIRYRGRLYIGRVGGTQPVHAPNGLNLDLGLSTGGRLGPRLLLVGATGTGPHSALEVVVGGTSPQPISSGRLTALLVPVHGRHRKVVVRETGTPGKDEVLRVEGYAAGR